MNLRCDVDEIIDLVAFGKFRDGEDDEAERANRSRPKNDPATCHTKMMFELV